MPKRLRALGGLDAAFLYLEESGTPMHVGSLMLLDAPRRRGYDFHAALVAHLAQRLPGAPALRRVLEPAPLELDHPSWREIDALALDQHVLRRRLPAPGSPKQLDALVARLHAQLLDRARPLWQFVVIDGLASGQVAMYAKIHHAVLDGQGGVALAKALLDLAPGASAPREPRRPSASAEEQAPAARSPSAPQQLLKLLRAIPPTLKLARDVRPVSAADAVRDGWRRLRELVLIAPRTPFDQQVSPRRSYASTSLPLDEVKRVARGYGVSLNDVVMTLCAAALRGHLRARKALPAKPLVAAMPVSLRAPGDTSVGNQVSMVQCPLPTDIEDPVERLRALATATGGIKRRVALGRGLIPTDIPGFAAPRWAGGLVRLWARGRMAERLPSLANVVISNVPGPPMALSLAGARIAHYFPVSIVTHGLGLNITAQSYAGQLEFGITACREALPRPDTLARALEHALDQLLDQLPA